jgi:hypothetical protein
MTEAIRNELAASKRCGREFCPERVIRGFQISSGGRLLDDAGAAELFGTIFAAFCQELPTDVFDGFMVRWTKENAKDPKKEA